MGGSGVGAAVRAGDAVGNAVGTAVGDAVGDGSGAAGNNVQALINMMSMPSEIRHMRFFKRVIFIAIVVIVFVL